MQTRFLLVRHATCEHIEELLLGRTLDAPLDSDGRRQARTVAEQLRRETPLRVESSPRRRALETARAIAAAASCELAVAPPLDELDFGNWSGRAFADLEHEAAWRHWNENRDDARTPAGVGIRALQCSVGRYLAALGESCAGATLVLVTHAEVIRSLVLHCLGAPARDYRRVAIDPASITRISVAEEGMRLDAVNESALP